MTRAAVAGVVTLLLVALTVFCALRGVTVSPSTGGLLVTPVPLTTISGAWVLGAVAAGTAAVLTGVATGLRLRRLRR